MTKRLDVPWPTGSSEMARRIREFDWATTPLGPIEQWPIRLKSAVDLMLASAQPAYIGWGSELVSLYNDGYIAFAGVKHPEALGQPFRVMWAEVWEDYCPVAEAVMAGQSRYFVDQAIPLAGRADRPMSWFTFSWSPLRAENGVVGGFYCSATETTEQVLAERALSQNYRALFDAIDEGFCIIEVLFEAGGRPVDYLFVETNPAFVNQTGLADTVGRRVKEFLPEHEQFWFDTYGRIARTGQPERFEHHAKALGRWYNVYAFRVGDPAEHRVAVLFNDITRRIQIDETLRASEAKYRALFDSLDEGVCLFERLPPRPDGRRDYRYVAMNAALRAMFGIPDLSGQSIRDNFPDDAEDWYDDYDQVLETGEPRRIERQAGQQGMVLEMFLTRVEDETGRRLLAVMKDVTQRHLTEQALRENAERQAFLLKLDDMLRSLSDPEDIRFKASTELGRKLGACRVAYADDCGDKERFIVSRNYVDGVADLAGLFRYKDYGPDIRSELESGRNRVQPDLVNDPNLSEAQRRAFAELGIGASLNVPLVKAGQLIAFLGINYASPHVFTASEIKLVEDVAERTWNAVERAQAVASLRKSEARYRDLANSLPLIIWQLEPTGLVEDVNDRWSELTGRPTSEAIGRAWLFSTLPDDQRRMEAAWNQAYRAGSVYEAEFRVVELDGGVRWFFSRGVPVKAPDGTILRWVGSDTDITELKRAQERTHFLMHEVNHRSKNLLAVVQAIAKQTAAESDPRAFAERFGERLQGLAATQDLLIRNDWKGTSLEQLIRSQLGHFADLLDTRIRLDGPPLSVTPAAAQNLGLALHELATNAGKYGALSTQQGELHISWRIAPGGEGPVFAMEWKEMNGPPVTLPVRRGLGSLLTTRITERAVEGEVSLAYDPEGLNWKLKAPLEKISVAADEELGPV